MRHRDALGHHGESLVEVKVDDITAFLSSTTVLVSPSQQTVWLKSTLGKSMLANPNYCFHLHMPKKWLPSRLAPQSLRDQNAADQPAVPQTNLPALPEDSCNMSFSSN